MAGQQMLDEEADILIGTDPDCDRVGVGVRKGRDVIYLSGNQTGALLIDFLAETGDPAGKTLITTVVTGEIWPEDRGELRHKSREDADGFQEHMRRHGEYGA